MTGHNHSDDDPVVRPLPTLLVGALGGLLVGITSVGSGSVIMIALLMLYPGLSAVRLVGTDLVQAVPLVLAAAISNITLHGLDWGILIPLVIGSVPGTVLGSTIAPLVPQSILRRGIVVVLTMSGVALLDKAGWAPLGAGEHDTHPMLVVLVGLGCSSWCRWPGGSCVVRQDCRCSAGPPWPRWRTRPTDPVDGGHRATEPHLVGGPNRPE